MEEKNMEGAKVYDIVYCSSDWHSSSDPLRQSVGDFIERAKDGKARADKDKKVLVVGVGDLFDLMKHGWKAFKSCHAVQQFQQELGDLEFVYVAGNHDPLPWIGEIMAPLGGQIETVPHCEVEVDGTKYYFAHGHQWDKNAWLFRLFTSSFIRLTSWAVVRRLIYWWEETWNPTPGALRRRMQGPGTPREREVYNKKVGWVHGGAGRHAETKDCVVVCGHTHKPWTGHAFHGHKPVLRLHDDGDLVDSLTYLLIDGSGAVLHRL
jgi:UDP-2,3-diacylglucosamine pyrophosphatase LpxH